MSTPPLSDTLRQLGQLYASAYKQQADKWVEALRDTGQNSSAQPRLDNLQTRYANFVREEGPKVVKNLAEASINYYSLVFNTGVEAASRYYRQVWGPDAVPAQAKAPTSQAQTSLLFRGPVGGTAKNAFLVTNHKSETIDISFELSTLCADDGSELTLKQCLFSPAQCQLGPSAEQVVQCVMQLPADMPSNCDYRGRILVAGFPELSMDIIVAAENC